MNTTRAGMGVVLFLAGATAVAVPGVAPSLPVAQGLVVLTGLSLVAAGTGYAVSTVRSPLSGLELSTPEDSIDLPGPGDEIEQQLRLLSTTPDNPDNLQKYRETRGTLSDHLRDLAVTTMVDRWGVERERARELLDEGAWSEDPHAVAFFTGSYPDWTPSSVSVRVNKPLVDFPLGLRARHVIDEIGAIDSGERDPPKSTTSSDQRPTDRPDRSADAAGGTDTNESERQRWGETS